MVKSVQIDGAAVKVAVFLTVSSCPMQGTIVDRVRAAVAGVAGVDSVEVELDVMSDEQRKALREQLQGPQKEIPFNKPGHHAHHRGGVGQGRRGQVIGDGQPGGGAGAARSPVGVLDGDIYGHSIPRIIGVDRYPTRVEGDAAATERERCQVISMLMFKPGGVAQAVAYRGPMNPSCCSSS